MTNQKGMLDGQASSNQIDQTNIGGAIAKEELRVRVRS